MMDKLDKFIVKHENKISVLIFVVVVFIVVLLLAGCGTTTDRQTKTVERITTQTAPITLDTPVGQIVVQPTQITVSREQSEVEQERKTIDTPDLKPLLTAAAGGLPFGGIISGIIGLGGAAFAGKMALTAGKAKRQLGELIDGIERAGDELPDEHWNTLTKHLEAEQSKDTKEVVKKRVG